MRKRAVALTATVLSVTSFVGMGVEPASAHFPDSTGFATCGTPRAPSHVTTLLHAHPVFFNQYVIQYECKGSTGAGFICEWEALYWSGGTMTGPYNISDTQLCGT